MESPVLILNVSGVSVYKIKLYLNSYIPVALNQTNLRMESVLFRLKMQEVYM